MGRRASRGRGLQLLLLGAILLAWSCSGGESTSGTPGRTEAGAAAAGSATPATHRAGPSPSIPEDVVWCRVERVLDGDTFDAAGCEEGGRVRLILIDAPESKAICFARESALALAALLPEGSAVALEKDVSDRDRYGRLLRYAWTSRGLVNAEMVREGWAWLAEFPPDLKYRGWIAEAQTEARDARRGVWGECSSPRTPESCDRSYPTVCIPPPPPDLGCRELPYRNFPALPPDPHRLDGDGDGIACEAPAD